MRPRFRTSFAAVMLLAFVLAACAAPVAVPLSPVQEEVEPPAIAASTPTEKASEAAPAYPPEPTATSAAVPSKTSTPLPTSYPPHPLGCIQAELPESVLILTWSERRGQHFITPVDSQGGRPLCNLDSLPAGVSPVVAYSPDMRQLALVASDREDGGDGVLQLLDLKRWRARPTQVKFKNWVVGMRFSPDGKQVAIAAVSPDERSSHVAQNFQILLADAAKGTAVAETRLDFMPRLMRFSTDGSSLIVYGAPSDAQDRATGEARALLLDTITLETLWETSLEGVIHGLAAPEENDDPLGQEIWEPAVVYAPQQNALYVVHADSDRLTTVNFVDRHTRSAEIQPKLSWVERLLALAAGVAHAKTLDGSFKSAALSPDGNRLFVVEYTADSWQDEDGNWQFTETPLGLKVIDLSGAEQIAQIDSPARQLFLSADGKKLFLRGWDDSDWTEILDISSLEIERRLAGRSLTPGRRLDGEPLLLSVAWHTNGQTSLTILDPSSYQETFKDWVTYNSYWLVEP